MSTDNGSSASQETQGSADETQTGSQSTTIKPEDHLRALDDLKKFKAQSRDLESKLQVLHKEMEEQKTKKLAEANDYKSLYEQVSGKYSKLKENIEYNERYKAATKAVLAAGIRPEALNILEKEDLSSIIVEYTTEGRTLTNGENEFVDSFKKKYGQMLFEQKQQTRINGGGGNANGSFDSTMTPAKLYELEQKHGLRSDQYRAALEQYKKQKPI